MMMKGVRWIGCGLIGLGLLTACASMTGETAGRYFDDRTTTAEIKTKLATQDRLSTLTRVNVDTRNGVVTLTGTVPDQQTKYDAVQIASSVNGVRGVNDLLQVQGQPQSGYQTPSAAAVPAPPPPPSYVRPVQ